MKNNNDVTWLVSLVMAICLLGPCFGLNLTGCVRSNATTVVVTDSVEYWKQKYYAEHEELMLWRDICHMYYQFKDYEDLDENWEPVRRFTFWEDAIMDTPEWDRLNEIQGGDWEDFLYDW